ncbi:MAG TPA: hypothetical protein VLB07_04010 [Woeseiaceae bacterium]|nr:hypothetical protein [Woeseiaceae bacterium]
MNESNDTTTGNPANDALMAAAAALPKEISPGRDLWPGIEKALVRNKPWVEPRNRHGMFAQAAAVLLMIGASSGLTYLAVKDGSSPVSPVVTGVERVFEPVSGSFGSRYTLGPDFLEARNALAERLEGEMQKLSPESRAVVQKSLDAIHEAIVEINQALAEEPDNVLLQDLLLRTYHEEVALMQQVGGIRNSAMNRTDI